MYFTVVMKVFVKVCFELSYMKLTFIVVIVHPQICVCNFVAYEKAAAIYDIVNVSAISSQ